MSQRLIDAIIALDEDRSLNEVRKCLQDGDDPVLLIEDCRRGLYVVGERFDQGDYFLSELVVGAEIFKQTAEVLAPLLAADRRESRKPIGQVVLGTVKGDIHDLGKSIVAVLLEAGGFEVHDLGVDVGPEAFVEKVRQTNAEIVAMSALLTVAFEAMKETISALDRAGLRERVHIMVGGGPVDETVQAYIGADAYGRNAVTAVEIARGFVGATSDE